MKKYTDVILDTAGNALNAATVTVVAYPGSGAVTIYSDDGTTVVTSSILTTNSLGEFSFYAPPGRYNLQVRVAGALVNTITDVQIDEGIVEEVATMVALKALKGMVDGQVCEVISYYAGAIPQGGGKFKFDATSSDLDNGGTIIAPDAGGVGRWRALGEMNAKRFGAKFDGVTDDYAALDKYMASVTQYGIVDFGDSRGTAIISAQLTAPADDVLYIGKVKIKAKDTATGINLLFSGSGRTGIVMKDVEWDCNKSGRATGQSVAYNGLAFPSSVDCTLINVTVRNSLGYGGASATTISASGSGTKRFNAYNCKLLDCGTSATVLPADGIFVRGDNCGIHNCHAENVTDTAFVLEGCNYSTIADCSGKNCTALGAISNDTATDVVGSVINGLTGSCNYVGSTGGVVGVACFGAGNIRDAKVSGVNIRLENGATNLGPLIQVRTTSTGRVIGLTMDNPTVDYGGSTGVIAHAILVSDSDDVQINNPYLRVQRGIGASGIRFDGACANGIVDGGYVDGADYGVLVKNTSAVKVKNVSFKDPVTNAIYADDTSTVTERGCTHEGSGTAAGKAAGATLKTGFWQAWTPTYSTDLGDSAFSFAATLTTNLARYCRIGNTVFVEINYQGTLNAVTPVNIRATLPTGVSPQSASVWTPASVLNAVTYETGLCRTIDTGSLYFYRANLTNYSSGANIEGRISLSFEVT